MTKHSAHPEPLPTPHELKCELPISSAQVDFLEKSRQKIKHILDGRIPQLLLIVGPCSIHDPDAAIEYATKLQALTQSISDTFHVIMRVYFEKPRTTTGWKGMIYDPYLDGSFAIGDGLRMTRKLLLNLASMQIPAAAEFLDPASALYFNDLISWGCIGARTSESQTHRQMASGLPMPIAFKNSTSGCIDIAVNGVLAASLPQTYMGINEDGRLSLIRTKGNPLGHVALRGGSCGPNYDPESIAKTFKALKNAGLPQSVIIDCSHDNSNRKHEIQLKVFESVMHQIVQGNKNIRGLILESHINSGNQAIQSNPTLLKYAVSLTDPCLDWPTTEHLIRWGHALLKMEQKNEKVLDNTDNFNGCCELGLGAINNYTSI